MQIMDFRQFFSNDPWFLRHLFSVRRASFSSLRLSSSWKETKNMNKVASAMKKFANVALIIDVRGRSTFPWNYFRLDGKKVMFFSFNGLLLAMLNLQHIIGKKIVARPMMGFIAFLSVSPPPECEANSPCLLLHIFTQKSPRNCWTPHTQQHRKSFENLDHLHLRFNGFQLLLQLLLLQPPLLFCSRCCSLHGSGLTFSFLAAKEALYAIIYHATRKNFTRPDVTAITCLSHLSLVLIQPSPAFAEEIEASRNHSNISLFTSIFNQI